MAIDFPNSPTTGDTFTADNRTWEWSGSAWEILKDAIYPIQKTIVDAKGDLIVATADDIVARLAVGTNGYGLVADSAETTGVKWAAVGDVTLTGTQTLTNKTLTSPTLNTATINNSVVQGLEERWFYSNQAISGAENLNVYNSPAVYNYTTATGNFTLNIRYTTTLSLNSILDVNDSITCAFAITNGATARYLTSLLIDGVTQTVKWQGGAAPTAGNANSVDVYVFTILKTAATPTYIVLGSQTQFA
jgi:hypothetical protein